MSNESNSEESPIHHSMYEQLHVLAQKALRHEKPGHSLQPTLLVNDAVMKLLQQRNVSLDDRSQAVAAGANIIRRLLIDYARRRQAQKRGGPGGARNQNSLTIVSDKKQIDLIELNDALESLSNENPRLSQVVELRFFGGMTGQEIADHLDVSLATVNSDWKFAKAWLSVVLK